MFEKVFLLGLYAETPLHPGSGAAPDAAVDLPVQRERHTGLPIVQASSLKGVLRAHAHIVDIGEGEKKTLFGDPNEVGGLSVTDARLLALPLRTLRGVFCWGTCPLVLKRFRRDLSLAGITLDWELEIAEEGKALVPEGSSVVVETSKGKAVFVEDVRLFAVENKEVEQIAETLSKLLPQADAHRSFREKFEKDLVVMHDDVFKMFAQTALEIVTRIQLWEFGTEKEGTVKEGPWSEEHLPTDSLLYSLVLIPGRKKISVEKLKNYDGSILHVGGDETVGRGFVRVRLLEPEEVVRGGHAES